jgi:hypothetical protein
MPGGVGGARASLASTRFDAAAGGNPNQSATPRERASLPPTLPSRGAVAFRRTGAERRWSRCAPGRMGGARRRVGRDSLLLSARVSRAWCRRWLGPFPVVRRRRARWLVRHGRSPPTSVVRRSLSSGAAAVPECRLRCEVEPCGRCGIRVRWEPRRWWRSRGCLRRARRSNRRL